MSKPMMSIKDNKWLVDRSIIEGDLDKPLTDDQWGEIVEELSGRVDNFIEEILDEIIQSALDGEDR